MSENTYTEKDLPVGELTVDRRVQRIGFDTAKVERMYKKWNPAAVGVVTVSRRKDLSTVIVDGMHRVEVIRRRTDNAGTVPCRIFEGLTLQEEAQMFLDLNQTTAVRVIDKFKVRITGEDPVAVDIANILGSYGWIVSPVPANGNVNAVQTVERLYQLSVKKEIDPNLVQSTILVITRAWGNERAGAQAVIFEGIGRLIEEYRDRVDLDVLIDRLKMYKGGPLTLHSEASQLAALRQGKVSMAVAELLVEAYNKGRRVNVLAPWRKRS